MSELPIVLFDRDHRALGALLPLRGGRWETADVGAIPQGTEVRALVFAPSVNVHWLVVPARARETWRQACRYSLEDQLAGDLEGVHVALPAQLRAGEAPAAVVTALWLEQTIAELVKEGWKPRQIYPGHALLAEGEQVQFVDMQLMAVRQQGLAAVLPIAAQLPGSEGHVSVVENTLDWLRAQVARIGSLPELLSGSFAPAVPKSQSQPGIWRWSVAAAAGAVVMMLATRWHEVHSLRSVERRLDAQLQSLIEQSLGPGTMRIAGSERQQITNELERRNSGSGSGVMALLVPLAEALNRQTQVRINAFTFRDGVLELSLEAPDVRSFDTLKEQLSMMNGLRPSLGELSYGKATVSGRMRLEPAT